MDTENQIEAVLSHVEPVLAVPDVLKTVSHWHEVLGFPNKWTWGDPPNHGGVSWHGAFVQFTHNQELASASQGNCIWIRVRQLEGLYEFHEKNGADIVESLQNKPWGMAQYTVRDINGYYVIFAGASISHREKSRPTISEMVRIVARTPSQEEYLNLVSAVGWDKYSNNASVEKILTAPVFAVVAEDRTNNTVIGCALLLGDEASFYYVKDVMVHPDWQRQRVGSAMMKELMDWLDEHAPKNAFTALITPENLRGFYQQFDFAPVFGMHRSVKSKNGKSGPAST